MSIAETSTVALATIVVATVLIVGAVGLYRARYNAAREENYRALAERSADELNGVRTELTQVRERLAALERLLSQIG
jgi:hypothetical protein